MCTRSWDPSGMMPEARADAGAAARVAARTERTLLKSAVQRTPSCRRRE